VAKVEFDEKAGVFHGEVINLRDVVPFEGENVDALRKAFQESAIPSREPAKKSKERRGIPAE